MSYHGDFTKLDIGEYGCNLCGSIFYSWYGEPRFCICQVYTDDKGQHILGGGGEYYGEKLAEVVKHERESLEWEEIERRLHGLH